MKKLALAIPVLAAALVCLAAAPEERPFASVVRELGHCGGWEGSKRDLTPVFAAERKRLGDRFQTELLVFIGDDPQRHYWVASFLTTPEHLHGQQAMPELALLILHQGIELCRPKMADEDIKFRLLSLEYCAAILSQRTGFRHQAASHKREYEKMLKENPNLAGAIPIVSPEERKVFESIKTQRPPAAEPPK
jgi:hypothetical protein